MTSQERERIWKGAQEFAGMRKIKINGIVQKRAIVQKCGGVRGKVQERVNSPGEGVHGSAGGYAITRAMEEEPAEARKRIAGLRRCAQECAGICKTAAARKAAQCDGVRRKQQEC